MKHHALIIDIRHQLPWHQRYLSLTMTAVLWMIWILLWRPIMLLLGIFGVHQHHLAEHLLLLFLTALEKGMFMLIICAIFLLIWNKCVPFMAVKHNQEKTIQDYAQHFGFDVSTLNEKRQQNICTVYHDEMGKITDIK